jgi:hypothetical protein
MLQILAAGKARPTRLVQQPLSRSTAGKPAVATQVLIPSANIFARFSRSTHPVIPAEAGIQKLSWVPASAGTTIMENRNQPALRLVVNRTLFLAIAITELANQST